MSYESSYEYSRVWDGCIQSGLHRLRRDDILCDVTLEAEGKTFRAHRVVLASVSGYFEAMFSHNFQVRDSLLKRWYELSFIAGIVYMGCGLCMFI